MSRLKAYAELAFVVLTALGFLYFAWSFMEWKGWWG